MSEIVLSGTITAILPAEQGMSQRTGQPWVSQEYVLCHEQGQYPRSVCFRIFGQEKIQQAAVQMGEYCTVHLNVDAKPSQKNGKYFNSIDCWKVEHQQPMQPQYQQPQGYAPQQQYQQPMQQPQYQQPMQQPVQQPMQPQAPQNPFPPQVNGQGQPMQQPQGQQQLPFPPAQ